MAETTSTLFLGRWALELHDGPGLRAQQGGPERRLRGVDREALDVLLVLAGTEQEGLDLVVGVALELVGDDLAHRDDAVVLRGW